MILFAAAFAQEPVPLPIDIERFQPAADGYGYVNTGSADTLEHLQVAFGLWLQQADDSVVLVDDGERVVGPAPTFADGMLDLRSRAELQFGVGFRNVLSLGATLPVVAWQQGFEPGAPGTATAPVDPQPSGLGDLSLQLKAALLRAQGDRRLGLAARTAVTAPTGSKRSFLGEGTPTLTSTLIAELSDRPIGEQRVRGAVELGGRFKKADTFRGVTFGSAFLWSTAIGVRPVQPLELGLEAHGAWMGARTGQHPIELVPHVRFRPVDVAQIVAGVGWGVNPGLGAPDRRLFAGFTLTPRFDPLARDRDEDGIPNAYDRCRGIAEDPDGFADEDGCPDPDNDQDGLPDLQDRCPVHAEDVDGFLDTDGCPDPDDDQDRVPDTLDACPRVPEDPDGFQDHDGCPEADNDGDGLLDLEDACPLAAETVNGFEDHDGCPDRRQILDSDGDGIVDDVDACNDAQEDLDGFEDHDGCPEFDNDGDGIVDPLDRCPDQPETLNQVDDDDGCPDEAPLVVVQVASIEIRDRVFFELDRAVIQSVSHPLLDEVARVLQDHPELLRVRVEGHTDSVGGAYYNQRLSQARAREVVRYLVGRGVAPERLEGVGFGESRPLDTNQTEDGRAINRRVEFVIVERAGG